MAYALGLFAFSGLMTAQALGALFACMHPWHHVQREHSHQQAAALDPFVKVAQPEFVH
jgi:hypothetical protein